MANTGNTQQQIDYGTSANDGTGDDLRVAFIKTDENFDNIWLAGPVGSNITITNNTVQVNNTNGNLILSPNGIGAIQTNSKLLPRLNNTYDLGSSTFKYRSVYVGAGGITTDGNITLASIANLRIPGGDNGYVIQTDGDSNLSWVALPGAGNGSPGGSNTQVQFNDGGLFGAANTFTFNKITSTVTAGNLVTGTANITSDGNSWIFNNAIMTAPSGATWQSNQNTLDEYISSATNGYLNFQTYDVTSNIATQLHMEHGLVHINVVNGANLTWEFNNTGLFTTPGNIIANGNITGNYFLGDGSQLINLPGGVVQANVPPPTPNATTLWWDEITGRLYVWYTDQDGSQWVDAAPAQGGYGNSNVASYLAVGGVTTAISTTGNISGNYFVGNGSQLTGVTASTGNVTFSDQAIQGTGTQDGGSGLYLAPGADSTGNLQYLRVRGGDYVTHIHLDTGNGAFFDQYFGADLKYVKLEANGNVVVNTSDIINGGSNSATWTFDTTGNLTAPGAIDVGNMSIGQLPGVITADNNTTVALNVSGSDGGFLVDYIGEEGNANTSGGELAFNSELGNATYRISLSDDLGDGFATKIWRFDGTGTLTLPGANAGENIATQGGYITVGNLLVGQGGSLFNSNNDSWSLYGNLSDPGTTVFIPSNADAFNGISLDITNTISNVNVQAGGSIWSFKNNSTLGFPVTDVGNLPAATTPGLRTFVNDANLVAAGNFGSVVGNAGSNTVPVYSDGTNWRIG